MRNIKKYKLNSDYITNKESFEYPTVSYVEENTNVYYKEKPEVRIVTYTTTGASQSIKLVNNQEYLDYAKIVDNGEQLPITGTGALNYTFENPGEHQVELKFKDDATTLALGFYECTQLTNIPSNLFSNNTAVTDFRHTFADCTGLKSIPDNLFNKCTAVTNFTGTFQGCDGLTSIPANLFSNNTNVTNFQSTFSNCSGLTSIPSNLFSNNTKVTYFGSTFFNCYGLTSIPDNLFSNNKAVTSFSSTFYQCSGLTGGIPENLFSNNTEVTTFNRTFSRCSGLTGNTPVDSDGTSIYNRSGEGKDGYAVVTDYGWCFKDCTGLTDYSSIPSSWGGGGA